MCEYPDCTEQGAELDHIVPVAICGKSTLHNCVLLCRGHHVAKTRLDIRLIAKGRRIRAKHFPVSEASATEDGPANGRIRKPKKKSLIKSRGFDKKIRKRMNGSVERVETDLDEEIR